MATFLQVQQRVAIDCLNRVDLVPETKRAILATIRYYENQRFWFNETATALACSAGQASIAFPSDFLVLDEIRVRQSSVDYELVPINIHEIHRLNADFAQSLPQWYCQYGQNFEIAPIPDSAYPVTVNYLQKLPALSADSDTNDWLSAGEDMVVYGAAKLVAAQLGDAASTSKFAQLEDIFYKNLCKLRDQKTFSHLTPTKF